MYLIRKYKKSKARKKKEKIIMPNFDIYEKKRK
jgi:hypothetical protein